MLRKLLIGLFFLLLLIPQVQAFETFTSSGKVLELIDTNELERDGHLSEMVHPGDSLKMQLLKVEVAGQEVEIENYLEGGPFDMEFKAGDQVFLQVSKLDDGSMEYEIRDRWYLDQLFWLSLIVLALIILFGGKQALKALLALFLSALLIFFFFIPMVEKGYTPSLLTLITSFLITLVSLVIILGFSRKTMTAVLGTFGGVIFAILLGYLGGIVFLKLNGLGAEDSRILAASFSEYNFSGILLSGFVIGALGACMDVAVSIASSLDELCKHHPHISSGELFSSGMRIGRDVLGSMLNTLIFAYVGASLTLVLLLFKSGSSIVEILNYGFIVEEIVRSLIGALGLAATIPVTAVCAAYFYGKKGL